MTVEKKIVRLTYSGGAYTVSIVKKHALTVSVGKIVARETEGQWIEEILIGTINNANKYFYTSYNYKPATTQIFQNGLRQLFGIDFYERANKQIEFAEAPSNIGYSDNLLIRYRKA